MSVLFSDLPAGLVLGDGFLEFGEGGVYFVVGQGAVGGAVGQGEGEAFVAFGEAFGLRSVFGLGLVDVEDG